MFIHLFSAFSIFFFRYPTRREENCQEAQWDLNGTFHVVPSTGIC